MPALKNRTNVVESMRQHQEQAAPLAAFQWPQTHWLHIDATQGQAYLLEDAICHLHTSGGIQQGHIGRRASNTHKRGTSSVPEARNNHLKYQFIGTPLCKEA